MSLTSVQMSEEVWLTCLAHSLTTETEEIMGLLLGDIEHLGRGNSTALIWGASPQMRSYRRKDRVETNPELLAAAAAQAERMTMSTGRTTRVIGWYHSHPHITVLPSHVDVRTQAMYQLLDSGFIGLIFSCFSEDALKVGRIQVIAFQSLDGKQRLASPASIEVESSWSSSDNALTMSISPMTDGFDQDCGDSRAAKTTKVGGRSPDFELFARADANHMGKQEMREKSSVVYNPDVTGDIDAGDMTPSMQEALHRSNMDVSGAEYVRKEVPLHVLPARYFVKLESPMSSFTDMQHVLFEEERAAYNQAMCQNTRDGKMHPLAFIHHTSTYHASLCKLMEYCLSPAIAALQDCLKENEIRLSLLTEEAKLLEADPSRGLEMKMESPSRRASQGLRNVQASADQGSVRSPRGAGNRRKAS